MFEFVLKNPRFFRYWISSWSSELGDWIRNMTLMFIVMDLSKQSVVSVSANMFCEFAPIFMFGFLVGVFADRWNRQKTLMTAILFRAFMMGFVVLAITLRSLTLIYICSFLSAFGTLFFRASASGFTTMIVAKEDRKVAASLRQLSTGCFTLIGPPIGTGLYILFHASGSIIWTIILLVTSSILIKSIKIDGQNEQSNSKNIQGVWNEMKQGFKYSWNHHIVRPILYSYMFFGFGAGMFNVLEVFILVEYLGIPKEMLAVLASVQGGSMILSSIIIGKLKFPIEKMIPYGMFIIGISMAGMVSYKSFYVTVVFGALFSLGQIALNISFASLMQTKVDLEFQGRTSMILSTTFNGLMVISMFVSGWLHELFSVRLLVALSGVAMLIGGGICYAMLSNSKDISLLKANKNQIASENNS